MEVLDLSNKEVATLVGKSITQGEPAEVSQNPMADLAQLVQLIHSLILKCITNPKSKLVTTRHPFARTSLRVAVNMATTAPSLTVTPN